MTVQNPLSPKVIAAAAGAGGGAIIGTALLWVIGAGFFDGGWAADQAQSAVAAVPGPLAGIVLLVVTVAGAALPGYNVADPNRVSTDEAAMVSSIKATPATLETIPTAWADGPHLAELRDTMGESGPPVATGKTDQAD